MLIVVLPSLPADPLTCDSCVAHESRAERTQMLLQRARDSSPTVALALEQEVVLAHLDVADSIGRRYRRRGAEVDDLVQVARVGLVEATHRFDPDRGAFLAYAVPTMIGHVKRHFRDLGWSVRPPRRLQDLSAELSRADDDLAQRLQHTPDLTEVAHHLRRPPAEIVEAATARGGYRTESLDARSMTDGQRLSTRLGREEDEYARVERSMTLRPFWLQLPLQHRRLLQLRFDELLSQQEIADRLGLSQMQVSRLLARLLLTLRGRLHDGERPPSPHHCTPDPGRLPLCVARDPQAA